MLDVFIDGFLNYLNGALILAFTSYIEKIALRPASLDLPVLTSCRMVHRTKVLWRLGTFTRGKTSVSTLDAPFVAMTAVVEAHTPGHAFPASSSDPGASRANESMTQSAEESARAPSESQARSGKWSQRRQTGDKGKPTNARSLLSTIRRNVTGRQKGERLFRPNLETEMELGTLPVAMLKMHFDRDDKIRRVYVLLQNLSMEIKTSIRSITGSTMYKIELDYGGGLFKWVVYRDLRDFLALHTYFRTMNVKGVVSMRMSNLDVDPPGLPSFPRGVLPQLLQWQRKDNEKEHQQVSEQERYAALSDYLHKLVKFVIFKAEANRLCRFLELSHLAIQMSPMSTIIGKQGYLQIRSKSSRAEAHNWDIKSRRAPRWFIVRESFLLIVDSISGSEIHDVFLMDRKFEVVQRRKLHRGKVEVAATDNEKNQDLDQTLHNTSHRYVNHHRFIVSNAERELQLVAPNEREMEQFLLSIKWVAKQNPYGQPNRFGSFAPIRHNVAAHWFVDGRDYYWQLSEAISLARERIYIHDWWLSPELYLRRPGTLEWRLDNLLQRKAQEGVRIHVILYNEVSNNFTPTDANYAKQRLMNLHPNITVQRSPNHIKSGTFYWAHHEKLCVIDELIAFVGGFDLCFGRWDTACHALIDEVEEESMAKNDSMYIGPVVDDTEALTWPGQDYANERVAEWHTLNKPRVDLLNRSTTPRMPWHDVGAQLLGAPARDLSRHFCQRWNMLLRTKKHTRTMPFLAPPAELTDEDADRLGVRGTCEVQICRSAGPWSLRTPKTVEHSIQTAYLKAIERSEHFVYIENQFFVTSTEMDTTEVENSIGLALVERIVRAHKEKTLWRAIIVIPLTPGFPAGYDLPESGSVRIVSTLQYLSISRGTNSIYDRLLRAGIDPEDYITFYSLRSWGRHRSGSLVTEQIYPHDKVMIVDDRLAIIGSANINERSQRGDRDSELACVVRDSDMIDSQMAGKPYKVGRFPHTLRMRLMREHLGLDVDALDLHAAGEEPAENFRDQPVDDTASKASSLSGDSVAESHQQRRRQHRQVPRPKISHDCMVDPVALDFFEDVWEGAANYNTEIYRRVFQCTPDDEITTWAAYKVAHAHLDRVRNSVRENAPPNSFTPEEVDGMVEELKKCCGHLVHHPLHFMERDAAAGNYLFPMDHINPLVVFD